MNQMIKVIAITQFLSFILSLVIFGILIHAQPSLAQIIEQNKFPACAPHYKDATAEKMLRKSIQDLYQRLRPLLPKEGVYLNSEAIEKYRTTIAPLIDHERDPNLLYNDVIKIGQLADSQYEKYGYKIGRQFEIMIVRDPYLDDPTFRATYPDTNFDSFHQWGNLIWPKERQPDRQQAFLLHSASGMYTRTINAQADGTFHVEQTLSLLSSATLPTLIHELFHMFQKYFWSVADYTPLTRPRRGHVMTIKTNGFDLQDLLLELETRVEYIHLAFDQRPRTLGMALFEVMRFDDFLGNYNALGRLFAGTDSYIKFIHAKRAEAEPLKDSDPEMYFSANFVLDKLTQTNLNAIRRELSVGLNQIKNLIESDLKIHDTAETLIAEDPMGCAMLMAESAGINVMPNLAR